MSIVVITVPEKVWLEIQDPRKKVIARPKLKRSPSSLKPGDILYIVLPVGPGEKYKYIHYLRVDYVTYWPTWTEMIKGLGLKNVKPGMKSIKQAVKSYEEEFGPENKLKYGVYAIQYSRI